MIWDSKARDIDRLIKRWSLILKRIKTNGGNITELTIGNPATILEISAIEAKLGINLPNEFKTLLIKFAKQLYFRWSLPDEAILPNEFKAIFSGELGWSLEWLEYWSDELTQDYPINLQGKLTFFQVGNGDYLAFDLSKGVAYPVVYWDHETDTVTPISASFMEYINNITELNCIGAEIWQYECFLGSYGIEINSEKAERWKAWFESFQSLQFVEAKRSIKTLFQYIMYHGEVKAREVSAFQQFNHKEILDIVLMRLSHCSPKESKALCLIIGEVVQREAEMWVRGLWSESKNFDPEDRSYLTSRCLPFEEGYQLVLNFFADSTDTIVNPFEALNHLSVFQSNRVIGWLEKNSRLPATNGWAKLFAFSSPTWEDLIRWSELETRHRLTIIHALEEMICEQKKPYEIKKLKISGVPSRKQLLEFLWRLHDTEELNTKKSIIKQIIENVDKII